MFKIDSIEPSSFEYVTMSDGYPNLYRRYYSGVWEAGYGESWETCYSEEQELEEAYQAYIKEQINADKVKKLREDTGAGLMFCKKALYQANGNMEEAKRIIGGLSHSSTRLVNIKPITRELFGDEHLVIWEAIQERDPIDEWNNQRSYTEEYIVGGTKYHVHYIEYTDVPMIEEIL